MDTKRIIEFLLTLLGGSGGVVLIMQSFPEWLTYKKVEHPTGETKLKKQIARGRSIAGLILVLFCIFLIFLLLSPDFALYSSGSESSNPSTISSDPAIVASDSIQNTMRTQAPDTPKNYVEAKAFTNGKYAGFIDPDTDAPNGYGIMSFDNGDIYEGNWLQGKKYGNGIMHYRNGDVFEGNWESDKKNGYGRYEWYDGKVYSGYYKDDKRNGVGTFTGWTGTIYSDEVWTGTYVGEHINNKFEGYGTFTISNGDSFTGIFKNGEIWSGVYIRNGVKIPIENGRKR